MTDPARGNVQAEQLPHSQLIYTFATHRSYGPVDDAMQTKPLKPDYPVQPTREDLAQGRDAVLEKLFDLARK